MHKVHSMRKLCPNLDKEDGLETVLEVPIPEEMFNKMGSNAALRWRTMRNLMKAQRAIDISGHHPAATSGNDQFMLLLKLVGSAFIPYQVQTDHAVTLPVKDGSIEASTAKYIVQQYLAATGGLPLINAVNSMYAVGQVKMVVASDVDQNSLENVKRSCENVKRSCEAGGFVLWQKNPDLWYLELVVSGCKISAGSDGKIGWSQSSSNSSASKGPPRPLRRFFQGLDPRSTANLFLNAVCIGEKTIKNEDCFILKLETSSDILKAQSTTNTEIVHHTMWGYFSQRTGLLVQFEDTKLVRMKAAKDGESVFYETSMESVLDEYRYVEGINIAHSGKSSATLYRYGKTLNRKWKLEETWKIEEVDFNICGLSVEYFLPPADVTKERENEEQTI
ncbi:Hypothetical predicted protein [Olea europaea subsp. europaea]|uniref:Uncharacterized protein n=1 Tax=Olea europaea subsp. europaea TaxID=158383 RepID=A0A8S0RCY4_OLEEU|nr:Hypothetical predicted protein [Olea europaea subsp. europaea]